MTEEAIFIAALEWPTPADRAAYLDEACAGDAARRQRVETLLASHGTAGFLETPAIRRAVGCPGGAEADQTRTGVPTDAPHERLDFLTASDKPGSLGRLDH